MNTPLVSICIPAYKNEKTIVDSINSALNQTYRNIEIVIVDDKSPDKTFEILQSFNDPRIKLYRNEQNLGMCGNWNKCLDYATGKYVHYLHGDDLLFPECIEKKVKLAEENPDIVLVFSATEIINSNAQTLMIRRYKSIDAVLDGKAVSYESLYRRNIFGEPSNVLFKREILGKSGLFCSELKYATDWELWLRIAYFGKVGYVSDVLMKYRVSDSNVTSSLMLKEVLEDDRIMIEQLKKFGKYRLSFFRIFVHKFVFRLRAYARIIYMKLYSNKKVDK